MVWVAHAHLFQIVSCVAGDHVRVLRLAAEILVGGVRRGVATADPPTVGVEGGARSRHPAEATVLGTVDGAGRAPQVVAELGIPVIAVVAVGDVADGRAAGLHQAGRGITGAVVVAVRVVLLHHPLVDLKVTVLVEAVADLLRAGVDAGVAVVAVHGHDPVEAQLLAVSRLDLGLVGGDAVPVRVDLTVLELEGRHVAAGQDGQRDGLEQAHDYSMRLRQTGLPWLEINRAFPCSIN